MPDLHPSDLGPCCCCGAIGPVRTIISLDRKAPVPGTGWGCVVCGLPPDGALAVLCDACVADFRRPKWAFKGHPRNHEYTPIEDLVGKHDHNLALHPEEQEMRAMLAYRNN